MRGTDSRRGLGPALLWRIGCGRVSCRGAALLLLESEKGVTPARRAISCSPICQCMASAARHGMAISSAMRDHISALNLIRSDLGQPCYIEAWKSLCSHTRTDRSRSGETFLNIPLVQPRKLILAVLVPFTPSLKIILIVQTTANGTSTRKMFADILPFHSISTKLDYLCIFLWRPL